jgi:hypothetical protein
MPKLKSKPVYQTHTVNSLSEFIILIEQICERENYLFRGQNCDWPLIPKIGRVKTRKSLLETEDEMLTEFKRLSKPFLNSAPTNELEWLSLAQHHGMATRLLDWTTNPLAAAWFAVQNPCPDKFGILWMFDAPFGDIIKAGQASLINPFIGARSKIFQPNITTSRIQSQNGWFTLHKYHDSTHKFTAFERNRLYNKYLTKIVIPSNRFSSIRFQLDRLGINERSLFPDIDGTANYVEWLHTYLADEENDLKVNDNYSIF